MSKFKRRPQPSTVISLLALFVALGGTATAASVLIRSSNQINPGAVARSDIANDAINSKKIADKTVKLNDLGTNIQSAINAKPTGGDALGGGSATEAFRPGGPANVAAKNAARVLTLENIKPGSYVFFAKATLAAEPQGGLLGQGASAGGHCALHVQDDPAQDNADDSRNFLASPGANTPGTINLQILATFDKTGKAYVDCDVTGAPWSAANSSIIAIPVPVGPRQEVGG
jgi:hypothetical protein